MLRVRLLGAGFSGRFHVSSVFRFEHGTTVFVLREEAATGLVARDGAARSPAGHRPVTIEYTI